MRRLVLFALGSVALLDLAGCVDYCGESDSGGDEEETEPACG